MDKNIEEEMSKIASILATPQSNIKIKFGTKYLINEEISTMDTFYILRMCNKFCEAVGKDNVYVEISNTDKALPQMKKNAPYIVIESSAKGIIRAVKKHLSKRKYVTVLEDDFNQSNELAMMVFKVKNL